MNNESMEIMRFCRAFMRNVGDSMPIRASQFAVLNIMCTEPGPHVPAALAQKLHVSKAMISGHIAALIQSGLIVRVPSPEDGRSVYVMPSKRGRDLFNKIVHQNTEKMNAIKLQLGGKKFDAFVKMVAQINQIIDE